MASINNDKQTKRNKNKTCLNFALSDDLIPENKDWTTMEKHAPDSCPRCGEIFVCKVNNILQCDCMKAILTKAETAYIANITEWEYDGNCLCNKCLEDLKKEISK